MIKKIIISGIPEAVEILNSELQNGFFIETEEGRTLNSFLTDSCGITEDYIANKVKTIFHNSNPVDAPASVMVRDGSVIAISGAMPGLVGAMMRIGSPYAVMRESITEKGNNIKRSGKNIYVKLKLFNIILNELGGRFLSRGIILGKESIIRIIKKSETNRGGSFLFNFDNIEVDSTMADSFTDEKYMISIHE